VLSYVRMYANWLAQRDKVQIGVIYPGRGIPMLYDTAGSGSSILAGEAVYAEKCFRCHGRNGWGNMGPVYRGIQPPPIAGPNSFNQTATTAARQRLAGFIYNNMPPGATHEKPVLSKQEALDVGIYLESLGRPSNFVSSNRSILFLNYIWLNSIYYGVEFFKNSQVDPSSTQATF